MKEKCALCNSTNINIIGFEKTSMDPNNKYINIKYVCAECHHGGKFGYLTELVMVE
jgi:hypothetical protein